MQWISKSGAKVAKWRSKDYETESTATINRSLLQICVANQIIVFDLSGNEPQEVFYFNATHQFMNPERYVESGIQMSYNFEDPSKRKDGCLFNSIIANRDRSNFFYRQERVLIYESDKSKMKMKTPCVSMFRNHSEIDIVELVRISDVLSKKKRLDDVDMQAVTSMFDCHTVFSIFSNEEKFHEQILTQITEREWPNEVQEDESEIQNNILRRLYRILTMPTPLLVSKKDAQAGKGDETIVTLPDSVVRPMSGTDADIDEEDDPEARFTGDVED